MSRADRTNDTHWVYRCFDVNGRLVYVGSTTNVFNRMQQHRAQAWWAPTVAKVTAQVYPNGIKARQVESTAIRDEVPRWNKAGKWAGRGNWTEADWQDWFIVLHREDRAVGQLDTCVRDYESLFGRPLPDDLAALYRQACARRDERDAERQRQERERARERAVSETKELVELNAELRGLLDRQEALARALGVDWDAPSDENPEDQIDAALAALIKGRRS